METERIAPHLTSPPTFVEWRWRTANTLQDLVPMTPLTTADYASDNDGGERWL